MIGDLVQPTHLLLILIVALVVLGPKRLPEAGRSLGKGLRDFKDAMTTYSPGNLLDTDEPDRAAEPEAQREPPAAASAAQGPPPAHGSSGTVEHGEAANVQVEPLARPAPDVRAESAASEPVDAEVVPDEHAGRPAG